MSERRGPSVFYSELMNYGFLRTEGGTYKDSEKVRAVCIVVVDPKSLVADALVGLWVFDIPGKAPNVYYKCHIYGSIGIIFPDLDFLKVVHGSREESAWKELIDNSGKVADHIDSILSVKAMKIAFAEGRFDQCLIRKEARSLLQM